MTIELGFKSDPVEYRYSYEWLFALMEKLDVHFIQLGSSFEMFSLPDRFFTRLRNQARDHGVTIHSCFTAHRELGGLMLDDEDFRQVARTAYRRWIEIGSLVGAASVGSNPGAVYRDHMEEKAQFIERYFEEMEELSAYAGKVGLQALTLETMSALGEPPTTTDEIRYFMEQLNPDAGRQAPDVAANAATAGEPGRAPVYICSDMAHGFADENGRVVQTNLELFECAIPWMWEFHIKNTDAIYDSTFGFSPAETERGIVDLEEVAGLISRSAGRFPREAIVGYLELPGPKLGRDYSDYLLEDQIMASIAAIRRDFLPAVDLVTTV